MGPDPVGPSPDLVGPGQDSLKVARIDKHWRRKKWSNSGCSPFNFTVINYQVSIMIQGVMQVNRNC